MSFIINRWVRGQDFHGRAALLEAIAARKGKPTWVLGNRRAGKTSLLRQLHHLCRREIWPDHLALYWDLQGAGSADGLKEAFLECLEDNEEVTEILGLKIDELEDANLGEVLNKFRRKAKNLKGRHLLLLIDECEELVDITRREPGILAPFRKLSQGDYSFNIIMTGSWRMMDLDESDAITSPFLPDFLPPLLLGPFSESESVGLLTSKGLADVVAARIHALCLGNPHLLQVLGEQVARTDNLELALAELKHNKVGHYFFQSNFNCLPPEPRPFFADGEACRRLAQISPDTPYFPYLTQSALVYEDNGLTRVSPLLQLIEGNLDPAEILANLEGGIHPPAPPETPEDPPTKSLGEREPQTAGDSAEPGPKAMVEAFQQAACFTTSLSPLQARFPHMLETAGPEEGHALLDQVAPEYLNDQPADERTAVYLVGLYWYRRLLGCGPFASLEDPLERARAIAGTDVPIDRDLRARAGITGKQAMILLRCLRADPAHRYQKLSALGADLAQA